MEFTIKTMGTYGKSAMASHCIEEGHMIGGVELIKDVWKRQKLDAWESLFIERGKNLVNIELPNIMSPLFKLSTKLHN
jgi:hypothetical protein